MWKETFIEQKVTYTIEVEGNFVIVENVPAKVCLETGEQLFSPETVEQLQNAVWGQMKPVRIIQIPVFEFPPLQPSA
jgi:YgiT-type zinc finger domain-containing protein